MDEATLDRILEAALLAAGRPLTLDQLAALFEPHERPDKRALRAAITRIAEACATRGIELKEVASGWRFQVKSALSPWISRLWEERPGRYSRALLETLALIAYRQPITRGEIEEIRGVSVSSSIMRTLQERGWVRVVGHRDAPGRPAMYGTTREFLDYFGLRSLEDLPTLQELKDVDQLTVELEFPEAGRPGAGDGEAGRAAEGGAQVVPLRPDRDGGRDDDAPGGESGPEAADESGCEAAAGGAADAGAGADTDAGTSGGPRAGDAD